MYSRYCTPEGIMVLGCSGNCKLSFDTDTIVGNYSYNEKLSGSIGFGGGVGEADKTNGKFSASIGWSNVNEMTEDGAHIFTMSEVLLSLQNYETRYTITCSGQMLRLHISDV